MYCAITAEPIEMPFGGLTHMGQRDHILDGVKIECFNLWVFIPAVYQDPRRKGQFWGLSGPLKSIGSLLRCTPQKG